MEDIKATRTLDSSSVVDKTTNLLVAIFDGVEMPRTVELGDFGKTVITFGRGDGNDIILKSKLVSLEHGRFHFENNQWVIEDKGCYQEKFSTNGIIYNNSSVLSKELCDGDFIRIDDGVETISEGVLFVFFTQESEVSWDTLSLDGKSEIVIGCDNSCDINLSSINVSKLNVRIVKEQDGYYIIDNGSANGVMINNCRWSEKQHLHEKDVIVIVNTMLIFTSATLYYSYKKCSLMELAYIEMATH